MYSEGLGEPISVIKDKSSIEGNPYGFTCRTTQQGSMTQQIMLDFAIHFVKNLPSTQGKLGEPVILFLDGHSSRWDVPSLLYFMENNVYPFFIASHTSVWAQPNDSGPNKRMHTCVETAVTKLGLRYSGKKQKLVTSA